MSLRIRTMFLVCAGVAGLIVVLFVISLLTWSSSLREIEDERVRVDVRRAAGLLRDDVRSLAATVSDWSHWDEAYAFVQSGDAAFVEANLTAEALQRVDVDGMAFVRDDGTRVWARLRDAAGGWSEFPDEVLRFVDRCTSARAGRPDIRGFARLGDGIALVASSAIVPSVDPAPGRGRLVAIRRVDERVLHSVRERARLTVLLTPVPAPDPADPLPPGTSIRISERGDDQLAGEIVLLDALGEPVSGLSVLEERGIRNQGRQGLFVLTAGLAVSGLVFAAVTLLLLERHVLQRLARLAREVREIGREKDLTKRATAGGHDEITVLAHSVNSMLGELERLERVRAETEAMLQAGAERFRRLERMEAIGRLAGGVAHDFNNTLVVVMGYAEMLEDHTRGDAVAKQHLAEIRSAAERATKLTSQLLALGRANVVRPRVFDPGEMLEGAVEMLRPLVGARIRVACRREGALDAVRMDPDLLTQVFLTLGANAKDGLPDGGTLTLSSRMVVLSVETDGIGPGRWVRIDAADDGAGMDAESVTHAFEPVFVTRGTTTRTGMGLASVHGIIVQAGGHVQLGSAPGKGTTVTIHLPSAGAVDEDEDGPPTSDFPAEGDGERILVVDDEPAVLAVLCDTLTRLGYVVTRAAGPSEALAAARDPQTVIDCVVTDVLMPQMRGRELAERIREMRPAVPVIFVSGYPDDPEVVAAIAAGAAFVRKPFTADSLGKTVRRELDRAVARSG